MPAAEYEAVIGLEIHVQLKTKSKMFCRCDNDAEGAAPNQHTCPVCLGMPGTLPVPNRQAVAWAVKTAIALGCAVPDVSKFDRKQYFYPDLPKGYQISQYDEPLGGPGEFSFDLPDGNGRTVERTVGVTRLHLEEDAGKLTHPAGKSYSLVDLNRAGTPLMEIVTDPIVCSLEEAPRSAKTFLQELHLVMRYLKVSDADMEKGHLRADANISIRKVGAKEHGAKVEIKNLNSFKFVERGIRSEIVRQQEVLGEGGHVSQETRGFVEGSGKTVSQRSKEEAQDYRYFPEPDIPPLEPAAPALTASRGEIPKLPQHYRKEWQGRVHPELASTAVQDATEAAALDTALPEDNGLAQKVSSIWLQHRTDEAFRRLISQRDYGKLGDFAVQLAAQPDSVTSQQARSLARKFIADSKSVGELLKNDPEFAETSADQLTAVIDTAVGANPKAVADFKAGNPNALNVIVGAVMKETRGSANPTTVKTLVEKSLEDV